MRHRLIGVISVASAFAVLSACGSDGPTTPSASSITVNSASGFLMLGQTETFTATLNLSNGTTQPLTGGSWGTDAATVATVGPSTGLVTTVRSGEVTITVDAQGLRGTKRITVVPDYRGTWTGTYVVTSCTQTGGFAAVNLCGTTLGNGTVLPVAFFNITQTGGTIGGQTVLGSIFSNQFSTVAVAGGGLSFQTTAPFQTTQIAQTWQVNQATAGQWTGTVVQTWTDTTVLGNMVVGGTLQGMTKTGVEPTRLRPSGSALSLTDIAEAIRRRH